MLVLILPIFDPNKFNNVYDEIKNQIKICQDNTHQASIDGVWLWQVDKEKNIDKEARTEKKIWVDKNTLQEVPNSDKNSIEVFDWISVDNVEFKIDSDTKITIKDIETQKKKHHIDFGNGMSTPILINEKPCTIIVLEKGQIIDDATFKKIADLIKNA